MILPTIPAASREGTGDTPDYLEAQVRRVVPRFLEHRERPLDRIERLGAHQGVVLEGIEEGPARVDELEGQLARSERTVQPRGGRELAPGVAGLQGVA